MWRSAVPVPCSSATRWRRSATSPAALRPGGRLTLIAWQPLDRNEWLIEIRAALAAGRSLPAPPPGGPNPFGLAEPDAVRAVLTTAGFVDVDLAPVNRPFWAGRDAEEAYVFLSGTGAVEGMLGGLDDTTRKEALDRLYATMAAHATEAGVRFDSNAWLITAGRP